MLDTERMRKSAAQRRAAGRSRSPRVFVALGLTLALIAVGAWVGWLYWGSVLVAEAHSRKTISALEQSFADAKNPPALVVNPVPGEAEWIMRIPALGQDWVWPVRVGVDEESLAYAVGWYPGTAQPGQVGNFAVAGGCITGAQPFRQLDRLREGDTVAVEGAAATYVYTIKSAPAALTVQADESWVLDPVPGRDDVAPTSAFITLTTCEDLIPTPDRSVGFGVLTSTEEK